MAVIILLARRFCSVLSIWPDFDCVATKVKRRNLSKRQ